MQKFARKNLPKPSRLALSVLILCLFVTTLFAVALLVACLQESETADPPNYQQYMDSLEYIFAGVLLSGIGFIAVDAAVKDRDRNQTE